MMRLGCRDFARTVLPLRCAVGSSANTAVPSPSDVRMAEVDAVQGDVRGCLVYIRFDSALLLNKYSGEGCLLYCISSLCCSQ